MMILVIIYTPEGYLSRGNIEKVRGGDLVRGKVWQR